MFKKNSYLKYLNFYYNGVFTIKQIQSGEYRIQLKFKIGMKQGKYSTSIYNLNILTTFYDIFKYASQFYSIDVIKKGNNTIYVTNEYPQNFIDKLIELGFVKRVIKNKLFDSRYIIYGEDINDIDKICTKLFKSDTSSLLNIDTNDLLE
jgi:hypothetical protein